MQDFRRPISTRIQYIYKKHYEKKAQDRYKFLLLNAQKFCKGSGLPDSVAFQVLEIKIRALVKSYFLDVVKFKEYHFEAAVENKLGKIHSDEWIDAVHGEKQINHSKVAAFTMKWVMKHSPLAFWNTTDELLTFEQENWVNTANARFAISAAYKLIEKDLYHTDDAYLKRLMYHLMYRSIDERSLFGWMDNMLKNGSDRSFNVFLASPADVTELRDAAEEIMNDINDEYDGAIRKLNFYRWENDKRAEATSDVQRQIFHEAHEKWGGGECDIMILLTWHKFGEGTQKEFDYFFDTFVDNPSKKFIFCKYAKDAPVTDIDGASIDRLNKWVKSNQDKFSPLNAARDSVDTVEKFKAALRKELQIFIRKSS